MTSAVPPRLIADRRSGRDCRARARRRLITSIAIERRRIVDRRRGPERRCTLDRRGFRSRGASRSESPADHLRNALQLLAAGRVAPLDGTGDGTTLHAAVVRRLTHALDLLEGRSTNGG